MMILIVIISKNGRKEGRNGQEVALKVSISSSSSGGLFLSLSPFITFSCWMFGSKSINMETIYKKLIIKINTN